MSVTIIMAIYIGLTVVYFSKKTRDEWLYLLYRS